MTTVLDEVPKASENRVPYVCPPDHKHAETSNCYSSHKCRCSECREVRTAQHVEYRKRIRGGVVQQYTAAAPVAAHIVWLMREGWEYSDIERVSGVSKPTLCRVKTGVTKRVTEETADAILGTLPTMRHRAAPPRMVSSVGVARRIRALVAVGWTVREVARRVEKTPSMLWWYTRQERVTAATHAAVSAVYDELWATTPPLETNDQRRVYKRSRSYAANQGWAGPLAWDDDTIDDPDAVPDVKGGVDETPYVDDVKVARALTGERHKLNHAERRAAITIGHARHWSDPMISERLNIATDTVLRIRHELGLEAWADPISRTEAA